jgi:hypothetical protein
MNLLPRIYSIIEIRLQNILLGQSILDHVGQHYLARPETDAVDQEQPTFS